MSTAALPRRRRSVARSTPTAFHFRTTSEVYSVTVQIALHLPAALQSCQRPRPAFLRSGSSRKPPMVRAPALPRHRLAQARMPRTGFGSAPHRHVVPRHQPHPMTRARAGRLGNNPVSVTGDIAARELPRWREHRQGIAAPRPQPLPCSQPPAPATPGSAVRVIRLALLQPPRACCSSVFVSGKLAGAACLKVGFPCQRHPDHTSA